VEGVTFAMLSGRPRVSFAKWVSWKLAWLRGLITHDPSRVAILRSDSKPLPVEPAALATKMSLVSSRAEPR
jgi:hypothetical protein